MPFVIFFFLAKLGCLLLEDDDIHYHFNKFLLSEYIAIGKQVLKNYYNKIYTHMLNIYPNFVCDQNSYTNKINFL